MSRHEDTRSGNGSFPDGCRHRFAETFTVSLIQQFHDPQVLTTALQHHFEQRRDIEVDIRHRGEKPLFNKRADVLIRLAEAACMIGVGCHPLQSIEQDLLQRLHVSVFAANTNIGAAGSVLSLFTLVAEHVGFLGKE